MFASKSSPTTKGQPPESTSLIRFKWPRHCDSDIKDKKILIKSFVANGERRKAKTTRRLAAFLHVSCVFSQTEVERMRREKGALFTHAYETLHDNGVEFPKPLAHQSKAPQLLDQALDSRQNTGKCCASCTSLLQNQPLRQQQAQFQPAAEVARSGPALAAKRQLTTEAETQSVENPAIPWMGVTFENT